MRASSVAFGVALALLLVAPSVSFAQSKNPLGRPTTAEGKRHYVAGNQFFRIMDFEKAIEEYKAGMLSEPAPAFHYNLAHCYRKMGQYKEAIWHYEQFLARAEPPREMKIEIEAAIRQMTDELTRRAMTQPPLEPIPEPKPPTPKESAPKVVTVVEPGEPWYRDVSAWSLVGVGVVSGGVSAGLLLNSESWRNKANHEARVDVQRELHERADDRRMLGVVTGLAAGAMLTVGVIKLIVYPHAHERKVTTSFQLGVTRGGLLIAGRF